MIVRLVNFATERRAADFEAQTGVRPEITIPLESGDATWLGDSQVYMWYRGDWAPHSISVPLMALEWWFYQQQDQTATSGR